VDETHLSSAQLLDNPALRNGLADLGHGSLRYRESGVMPCGAAIIWGKGSFQKGKGLMDNYLESSIERGHFAGPTPGG
jgi:hypothetical protein